MFQKEGASRANASSWEEAERRLVRLGPMSKVFRQSGRGPQGQPCTSWAARPGGGGGGLSH